MEFELAGRKIEIGFVHAQIAFGVLLAWIPISLAALVLASKSLDFGLPAVLTDRYGFFLRVTEFALVQPFGRVVTSALLLVAARIFNLKADSRSALSLSTALAFLSLATYILAVWSHLLAGPAKNFDIFVFGEYVTRLAYGAIVVYCTLMVYLEYNKERASRTALASFVYSFAILVFSTAPFIIIEKTYGRDYEFGIRVLTDFLGSFAFGFAVIYRILGKGPDDGWVVFVTLYCISSILLAIGSLQALPAAFGIFVLVEAPIHLGLLYLLSRKQDS